MQSDREELIYINIKFKDLQDRINTFKSKSNVKAVKTLDVSFDEWFSRMFIDNLFEESVIPLVSQFPDLEVFRIDMGTGFAGKKMSSLCKLIEGFSKLREIRLELRYFTSSEEFTLLTAAVSTLKGLTNVTINISWNNISRKTMEDGFERLSKLPNLKELNLDLTGNHSLLENQEFTPKEVARVFDKVFAHLENKKLQIEFSDEGEDADI